jgi:hypothetical protein
MHSAGWEPYAHDDFIEAWVGNPIRENLNPSHCDFWRASRDGKLFTVRGYSEDGHDPVPPGQFIDLTLPVWRIGEGLLFAARVAEQDNAVSQIAIRCRFTGLRNRRLTSVDGQRILLDGYVSRTDEVLLNASATLEQIRDNLSEIVHRLLIPLYERFSFFELPFQLVEEELARMRRGRV